MEREVHRRAVPGEETRASGRGCAGVPRLQPPCAAPPLPLPWGRLLSGCQALGPKGSSPSAQDSHSHAEPLTVPSGPPGPGMLVLPR